MIGVLALQGGFHAHLENLGELGVSTREVRLPEDLVGLDGLILPGGESTTMLNLLRAFDMVDPLKDLVRGGTPVLATCAGTILLCDQVAHPVQASLALLPAQVQRNAYGCQRESFQGAVDIPDWDLSQVEVFFIRAPRFRSWSDDVRVLCRFGSDVVGVVYRNMTAVTFHPELAHESRFHEHWLKQSVNA